VNVDDNFGTDVYGQQQDTGENTPYQPHTESGQENASGGQMHENDMESGSGSGSENTYGSQNQNPNQYQNKQTNSSGYNSYNNYNSSNYNTRRPDYSEDRQPYAPNGGRQPLSNGLKVFLTVLFTLVPGIGQLAGIITAIVFMSTEEDSDRRSFGVALLVSNLILFVLACIGCFTVFLIAQNMSI